MKEEKLLEGQTKEKIDIGKQYNNQVKPKTFEDYFKEANIKTKIDKTWKYKTFG